MRKGPVLAGIGFGGVLLCALVPEQAVAWLAPGLVLGLAALSMAMPSEPGDGGGDGGGAGGPDGDQGGGVGAGDASGDAGGDAGGDGGGE